MTRIGPKRAPVPSVCPVCKAGPHAHDCAAVAQHKAHVEAVRRAWTGEAPKAAPVPVERIRPAETDEGGFERQEHLLGALLELAVPLWVQRFRNEGRTLDALMALGPPLADILGEQGTSLMWPCKGEKRAPRNPDGSEIRGRALGSDELFNRLAEGIAAASFSPGGAHVFGKHFVSDPAWLQCKTTQPRGTA